MKLEGRNQVVWDLIENWEDRYLIEKDQNSFYSIEDKWNKALKTWRPDIQRKILKMIDSIIFHSHMILQNSQYEKETLNNIVDQGRIFNSDIYDISDMKLLTIDQLRFIANQNLAKQRLVSLSQGTITGIGGIFTISLDLPLMLTINLRSIMLTAMTYGYDLRKPSEMLLVLKVFHVATLPKTMQKEGWLHLQVELENLEDEWLIFEEKNSYKSTVWLQQPLKQLGKGFILFLLRKKLVQGLPLVGMTIGGASNYFLAKQVSEMAHHFYQKRFLLDLANETW